ncbi:MAG: phosphoserine phosphatase SerB [Alphaproteobacteria bacterium]|nr:phosphoserine phosphatase SerB [Alphaproteobacteria bacterium]
MGWVMTLITSSATHLPLSRIVHTLASTLGVGSAPDWLVPGAACDLLLDSIPPAEAELTARRIAGDAPIDIVVQPVAGRRKRLLIADMESTIIQNEMLDELADFVGLRRHVAEITRRAMNGELDFAAALAERVLLLKGLPVSVLDQAATRIRLMPGAAALLATLRRAGVYTALVSGGFTVFAEPLAARLGFNRVVANRLDIANGHISGTVAAPIVTRDTKHDVLAECAAALGVDPDAAIAVGDGANDLPMLLQAGLGVAFHAKPAVAAAARFRLDHADLTGLLYAQGYRHGEIVRP